MPELPEVEALCRHLKRQVQHRRIESAQVFRPRAVAPLSVRQFCRRIQHAIILQLHRRGKWLVFRLAPRSRRAESKVLLVHLRMTGHLSLRSTGVKPPPSTAVSFHLEGTRCLLLEDPRGLALCQLVSPIDASSRLARLGVEPLSRPFTPTLFFRLTRHHRTSIKTFLMDQRHVAGLGNIYAAEALFRAGIHPLVLSASLSRLQTARLHRAIVGVLVDAVQSAGGYSRPGVWGLQETFRPQVYGRQGQPCSRCGSILERCRVQSRSTFYCPRCQPEDNILHSKRIP
ncbi:MAG: bifunctional DNA-formamidopyrimidine glycosylase/DNA-(apurinic or apyrimidinic site) lyase [Acidobacteria bacterium]|nr:bifunctional DNA-formamidopyrimidine glycosylase/DNA-(apurinic or apyrimidinic site) lyase [Acidobacteriota bacterium]